VKGTGSGEQSPEPFSALSKICNSSFSPIVDDAHYLFADKSPTFFCAASIPVVVSRCYNTPAATGKLITKLFLSKWSINLDTENLSQYNEVGRGNNGRRIPREAVPP
jgi:hypothetical protein